MTRRRSDGYARDPMTAARDILAARAARQHPGWAFAHGLYGWTATRPGRAPQRSPSLPGVIAMITGTPRSP